MATHCSILAWRILWTEEPGGLQSMGLQRVRHDWATNTFTSFEDSGKLRLGYIEVCKLCCFVLSFQNESINHLLDEGNFYKKWILVIIKYRMNRRNQDTGTGKIILASSRYEIVSKWKEASSGRNEDWDDHEKDFRYSCSFLRCLSFHCKANDRSKTLINSLLISVITIFQSRKAKVYFGMGMS